LKKVFFQILGLLLLQQAFAQCPNCTNPTSANCFDVTNGSKFLLDGNSNVDFTFDNMQAYVRGITYTGQSTLKLTVKEQVAGNCKWKLAMIVDNHNTAPNNEWEPLINYGTAGINPQLNLIEVSVYNGCGTPLNNGVFQTFVGNTDCDQIDIIPALGIQNIAGSCAGTQVNGPGSYINDYNEYTFHISYRIKPGFGYKPGSYQISIMFCLVEVP
jgi:opacity protein-like surface antigen